jgi:hypothetical protein
MKQIDIGSSSRDGMDNDDDDSWCRIYLAPSTIPGAGLGSFAGRSFVRGDQVTTGDAVVPIADMAYHNHGGHDHVDTFLWGTYW